MEGNWSALALGEDLRANVFHVFRLVFDDGELESEADLRSGEADSGGFMHGLAHVLDELLNGGREDFFAGEVSGFLAEDGFSGGFDFEQHRWIVRRNGVLLSCRIMRDRGKPMPDCTITITVDPQTAQAYHAAKEEERKKIEALLGLRARQLAVEKRPKLDEVMEEAARYARSKGMTPEILDSLLRDE